MSIIIPAILTDNPKDLEKMIRQAEQFTDYAQIDIMDGKFVPSKSIIASDLAKIKTNLFLEAHLMVSQPQNYIQDFKKAGAKKIIFHFEATKKPLEAIKAIKDAGLKAGLAINPGTKNSQISQLVEKIESVLFLSVNPGFYGAKFIPEVIDKAREFKRLFPSVQTGIDGGMKLDNVRLASEIAIDYICVGSAIFSKEDPGESFKSLKNLIS